jgi:hypothetical protein
MIHRLSLIAALSLGLLAPSLLAQGILSPYVRLQFFTNGGLACNACTVTTSLTGTSTPASVYQDAALTTAHAQPITLDSSGRPPAGLFLDPAVTYRFVLKDSGGTTIWTQDSIQGGFAGTISGTTNVLAKFNSTGSNVTNSSLTDTGTLVTSTAPFNVATSATVPVVIGGAAVGQTLTFQTTSGAGSGDSFAWTGGSNGATTFLTLTSTTLAQSRAYAIGTTSTDGHVLANTTAAAAGAQQFSPRIHFTGQGWKTNATAASQTVDWILENQPIQGAANPTTNLVASYQVNGGGYTFGWAAKSTGFFDIGAGWAYSINGTTVLTATTLSTTNLTYDGTSFRVGTTGPHAIGGALDGIRQWSQTGSFSGTSKAFGFYLDSTLIPTANNNSAGLVISPTITKAASGTHAVFAGAQFSVLFNAGAAAVTNAYNIYAPTFAAPASTTTATGLYIEAPTGATTNYAINIGTGDIYKAGTAYTNPDYAIEQWATGKIEKFARNEGADRYRAFSLEEIRDFARQHYYLPQLDFFHAHDKPSGGFDRADISLILHEDTFRFLFDHEDRLSGLERRLARLESH